MDVGDDSGRFEEANQQGKPVEREVPSPLLTTSCSRASLSKSSQHAVGSRGEGPERT